MIDWDNGKINVLELPSRLQHHLIEAKSEFMYADGVHKRYHELTPEEVAEVVDNYVMTAMSPRDVLELWLEYEGFLGYNDVIRELIDGLVLYGMKIHPSII